MEQDPKKDFVRKLRGVAIDWSDVWKILEGLYGKNIILVREVVTDVANERGEDWYPTRECCFKLMVSYAEKPEAYPKWWGREWHLGGKPYPRQEQVEQEFDMWFEEECSKAGKFLPRWYALRCQIRERKQGK
jgi:hypothetical protein